MDVCVAGSDLQSRHAHDKDLFLKTHVKKWNSRCVDVNKTDSTRQKIYTIATHQLAEKTKSNRVAPIFPHCCYWVMSCHYTTLQYFPNSRLRFTHSLVTHKSVEYKANEIKRIRYQQFRNSAEKKKTYRRQSLLNKALGQWGPLHKHMHRAMNIHYQLSKGHWEQQHPIFILGKTRSFVWRSFKLVMSRPKHVA